MALLDSINGPADLRSLRPDQLPQLAQEIRDFLVTSVTRTSLGSVEAGRVFHAWRVGSQASAAPYSTASARSALFAKSYAVSAHWLPNGCEGAAGSLYCTWTNDAAKTIILRVDQVSSPHLVVSVGGTY